MERGPYWDTFDRIRAALLKQEVMRKGTIQAFEAWVVKARPHFERLTLGYDTSCSRAYGTVLCSWLDWLDYNKLAWRGEIRWQIPTKGPLIFTPPSTEGMGKSIQAIAAERAERARRRVGKVFGEVELVGSTRRSAPSSAAPTRKTRGARGQGTVRKSPPPK